MLVPFQSIRTWHKKIIRAPPGRYGYSTVKFSPLVVGGQGQAPQDRPLWHNDYFELKAIKTQQIQE